MAVRRGVAFAVLVVGVVIIVVVVGSPLFTSASHRSEDCSLGRQSQLDLRLLVWQLITAIAKVHVTLGG